MWALSPEEIKIAYPAAALTPVSDGSAFEIKAATLAGVRWARIELRFDRNRQLVHLKLWTRARSYEQLEAELTNSSAALWSIGSDDADRATARRVMLCDYGAAGVALSFDQPSVALPKTITASLGAGAQGSGAN